MMKKSAFVHFKRPSFAILIRKYSMYEFEMDFAIRIYPDTAFGTIKECLNNENSPWKG